MKTEEEYRKPLPGVLPESEEYWKAAKRHELVFQKCRSCGQEIYFPRLICHKCLSGDLEWFRSSGQGIVYSYTIIHQVSHESFAQDVPYVYAIIELLEGIRMISNIINIDPHQVKIGMKVKTVFEDVTGEITIPRFEPVQDSPFQAHPSSHLHVLINE
jgi:hypothetical protein